MGTIETTMRCSRVGGRELVDFVVRTADATYRERLVKMGWQQSGSDGELVRRLDSSPDIEEIFDRFSRHVEVMVRQSARMEAVDWERGLEEFAGRVDGSGQRWWLYGSGALAVRGLEIEPGDLDLHVDDASLTGQLMADLLVEPVTQMSGWVADAGGRAYAGVLIEWIAGVHPSGADPPHEQEDAAAGHLELIPWKGRSIPVPRLDLQLGVAEGRGLAERVALIRRALTP